MASEAKTTRRLPLLHILRLEGWRYLLLSLLLQMAIGLLFGHLYDLRIDMATGYLVATGHDPYIAQNLSQVFNNPAFQGMTSIGYPPPWPILLGLIYLLFFAPTHNFLLYNLAIKLPIIAANLALAYSVRDILRDQGASRDTSHKAWLFMLFNPFLFYFNTAWGQFDSLVAVLTLFSLLLVYRQKVVASALVLGLAIALKPTPVPVVLAVMAYLWGAPWRRVAGFLGMLGLSLAFFCVLPFYIFHWSATPIFNGWNAQFTVSGGMSLTTLYELVKNTYLLPGYWWLLGIVWLPAVLLGALFIPRGARGFVTLLRNSLVLTLIFFLTRTWLSEQNLTLILPMVLILVALRQLPSLSLSVVGVIPFLFTIFNTSPAQLLFPILPGLMDKLLQWADTFRSARLVARMLLVLPWQVIGWWMVFHWRRKAEAAAV